MTNSAPKVGVVVPSGDMVHARFMVALVGLFQSAAAAGIRLLIINPRSSSISQGRQIGVDMAKAKELDYILFLDSDMVFPFNTLERLLQADKDVVGCTYVKRHLPTEFNHRELEGESRVLGQGLREVARLPTGCLLIKLPVFDDMAKPYFRFTYPEDGTEGGEDFYFCDEVRKRGGKIWMDSDWSKYIGHLGTYSHTINDLEV